MQMRESLPKSIRGSDRSLFSGERNSKQKSDLSESSKLKSSHNNFTVAVRIKPKQLQQQNVKIIINKNCKQMSIQTTKQIRNNYCAGKCRTFKMDSIFEERTTNQLIFAKTVKEKLSLLKRNKNVALMAYGATNSGKTYTILGSNRSEQHRREGLVHLSYRYLLEELFQGSYKFYFSYLEIYNENIQDLLCESEKRHNLNLFEDNMGKINIPQLTRIEVSSYRKLCELIEIGSIARAQSSNNINKVSSRSHAILQLEIFSIQEGDNQVTQTPTDSNFTIIDLAGSEKSSPYFQQSQQLTLKEGSNINRSLLSLGNCIKNLANGQSHIPYRNSKLTRLLKENLSGACHNIMIACISHTATQYEQSISTLQYASKACKIQITEQATKGSGRGKFVSIPCQHCKMTLDFGYICRALKQHAFQVNDLLIEKAEDHQKFSKIQPIKSIYYEKRPSQEQKILEMCINKIRNLCRTSQKLEYLSKILENFQNQQQKVQIQIQQTEDSQKQHLNKNEPHIRSKLKLKVKPSNNQDSNSQPLTQYSHRLSKASSDKSIKLKMKANKSKSKLKQNKQYKQNTSDYIKIQQQPKSLNISSINSRKYEYESNLHNQHHIHPFLPQLSLDISDYFNPKEHFFNGRVEKDFDNINFSKMKRNSEPRVRFYSKENKQNNSEKANIQQAPGQSSKTCRQSGTNQSQFQLFPVQSKILKRMKQDILTINQMNGSTLNMVEKGSKSKIKLGMRIR